MGAREDWRYADMRARWGRAWPLASFFLVYLIQQGMLVGLTLPLYAVFSSRRGWQRGLDLLATLGCITGTAPPESHQRGGLSCAHTCMVAVLQPFGYVAMGNNKMLYLSSLLRRSLTGCDCRQPAVPIHARK